MGAVLSTNEQVVLRMLTRCAALKEPCPSNIRIAESLGVSSCSTGAAVIQRLERKGLIRVERFISGRTVEIVATKQKTQAPEVKAPHWSKKKGT
jgi:predicted transcriptional regulator